MVIINRSTLNLSKVDCRALRVELKDKLYLPIFEGFLNSLLVFYSTKPLLYEFLLHIWGYVYVAECLSYLLHMVAPCHTH